jgi:hypothetical protein
MLPDVSVVAHDYHVMFQFISRLCTSKADVSIIRCEGSELRVCPRLQANFTARPPVVGIERESNREKVKLFP